MNTRAVAQICTASSAMQQRSRSPHSPFVGVIAVKWVPHQGTVTKATCFMSHSWRKHPRVMTSVSPAMTTKLIKLRQLTSQENPRKWSRRTRYARGGGEGAGGRERWVTPAAEMYPPTSLKFWCQKERNKKSKFPACKVEMNYVSRIKVSSVRTGRSTFFPFNEDGMKETQQTQSHWNLIQERPVVQCEHENVCANVHG